MTSNTPAPWHPWRNSDLPNQRKPLGAARPRRVGRAPKEQPEVPTGWWTSKRAASELGVATATVNRLCQQGRLRGVLVKGLGGGRQGAGMRFVDPVSVGEYREYRSRRRVEVDRNAMIRSHANNHGWPIAEAAKKLRGE